MQTTKVQGHCDVPGSDEGVNLTAAELVSGAAAITGGEIADMPTDTIRRIMTITQYVTDLAINELEARGEIEVVEGVPHIPYYSDHMVETILTRDSEG